MKPSVFIIILNWNGLADTLECLESLKKITYPNHKIIIIDNGSRNNEAKIIKEKYPEIHLIKNEKNEGFAEGNNIGIRYAQKEGADYILMLNNDTVVAPDFLDILIDYAENHKDVGIVGPKMFYYNSDKIWFNGAKLYPLIGLFRHLESGLKDSQSKIKTPRVVDYISGSCLLIKKEVIEKIGLIYTPFFAYYEETDWCFRARRAGYKNLVIPQSIIWHKVSASAGERGKNNLNSFQAYYYARNSRFFAKRNLAGFQKLIFLLANYTFALVYNLLRCKNNEARLSYFKGLVDPI